MGHAETTDRIPGPTRIALLDMDSGLSENGASFRLERCHPEVTGSQRALHETEFQIGTIIAIGMEKSRKGSL